MDSKSTNAVLLSLFLWTQLNAESIFPNDLSLSLTSVESSFRDLSTKFVWILPSVSFMSYIKTFIKCCVQIGLIEKICR